jgi:hypothetical protein
VERTSKPLAGPEGHPYLRLRARASLAILGVLAACSAAPPPAPAPPLDVEQVATTARTLTSLDQPTRILFEWSMSEQGGRFGGRGVARIEPPYRARLDLFLPSGETIARAALVGDDLRIPAGVPDGIIPPSHLLWGVLGVFRPGNGAALLGAEDRGEEGIQMRYGYEGGKEIRYLLRGRRVHEVELLQGGHAVQRVSLELEPEARYPAEAVYRDLGAFRELRITRESVENVEPYPPDIFDPGR